MINSTPQHTDPRIKGAIERINSFSNRFTPAHRNLARHAAFPLVLTPDLLYRLRDYPFEPKLQIPWIAVADLLLSELCYEVGQELYEMDSAVRQVLLNELTAIFLQQRLEQLSTFLLKYIERHINNSDPNTLQAQRWIALAHVKPTEAAAQITQKLKKILQQHDQSDWLQIAFVIETLENPLQKQGFQPLLSLAQGMAQFARGDILGAEKQFEQLRQQKNSQEIAQVTFKLPPPVPVEIFSFDVVTVNIKGQQLKKERHQAEYFTENLGNRVTLEMVYIPGGTFTMGSPETEKESSDDERPQHEVTISPFCMGKYPVTQAQWRVVAALPQINRELDPQPSNFKGDNLPVESILWDEAVEFCDRISNTTGKNYRLPSETEWEYACRAGTSTPFHFGETITSKLANYNSEYTYGNEPKAKSRGKTKPVGSYKIANVFGLFDMHGNVWEWCADTWHPNYKDAPVDGNVWIDDNDSRLLRGGSWDNNPEDCRAACRYGSTPDHRDDFIGFRLVCVASRTL